MPQQGCWTHNKDCCLVRLIFNWNLISTWYYLFKETETVSLSYLWVVPSKNELLNHHVELELSSTDKLQRARWASKIQAIWNPTNSPQIWFNYVLMVKDEMIVLNNCLGMSLKYVNEVRCLKFNHSFSFNSAGQVFYRLVNLAVEVRWRSRWVLV